MYSWQCVCLYVCLSVTYWSRLCQILPVKDVCTADNVCVSVCVCQWRTGVDDVRQCQSVMNIQLTLCVPVCVSVSDVFVSMMSDNASQRCMYSWQCVCLCVCVSVTYWCWWCQKMPVKDVCTADNVCVSVCVCLWRTRVDDARQCQSEIYVQLTMCVCQRCSGIDAICQRKSFATSELIILQVRFATYCSLAFSVAGPVCWNSLSVYLKSLNFFIWLLQTSTQDICAY